MSIGTGIAVAGIWMSSALAILWGAPADIFVGSCVTVIVISIADALK